LLDENFPNLRTSVHWHDLAAVFRMANNRFEFGPNLDSTDLIRIYVGARIRFSLNRRQISTDIS
jgi:hypothetical protein